MGNIRSWIDKLIDVHFKKLSGKKIRQAVMGLAVIVIFITTYALILPAISLDQEEGRQLSGFSLEGGSTSSSSQIDDGSGREPDSEENNPSSDKQDQIKEIESQSQEDEQSEADRQRQKGNEPFKLDYEGPDYRASATLCKGSSLPDASRLVVKELKKGSSEYSYYYSLIRQKTDAGIKGSDLRTLLLYQVAFLDSEGNRIKGIHADITITYKNGLDLSPVDIARGVLCKKTAGSLPNFEEDVQLIKKNKYRNTGSGKRTDAIVMIDNQVSALSLNRYSCGETGTENVCGLIVLSSEGKIDEAGKDAGKTGSDQDMTEEESAEEIATDDESDQDKKAGSDHEKDGEKITDPQTDTEKENEGSGEEEGKYLYGTQEVAGDDYAVSVTLDEKARIPADAQLYAKEISDTETYKKKAKKKLGITNFDNARFFDIGFQSDGKEIEPESPVSVTISIDNVMDQAQVIHFSDKKVEALKTEFGPFVNNEDNAAKKRTRDQSAPNSKEKTKSKTKNKDQFSTVVKFRAGGFSVYGIIGTTIEKNVLASDGKNYKISVTYGENANLPDDVDLSVRELVRGTDDYIRYLTESASILGKETDVISYARIFDISLVSKNNPEIHYQPKAEVSVSIELTDADENWMDNLRVLHITEDQTDVLETEAKGKTLTFMTDSFSIYPILDDPGDNARIAYRFHYNDGTQDVLLSTQYLRYKDVHPEDGRDPLEINEPSIPGIDASTWNRIFRGWSKNSFTDDDSNLITVADLNEELEAKTESEYVEGTFIDVYANLKDVYYVTYVDVNPNNILATEIVPKAESGDSTFTVKPESQLRPTIDSDTALLGWYDIHQPENVYDPGQSDVVIDANLTLYPKVEGGSWLIFDDNDPVWDEDKQDYISGGASFTPPAFYLGEATQQPADPTWAGYEFGGWYIDKECTTPFNFGGTLDHDTTVFAKWTPSDSQYRVIIWKQRSSNDVGLSDDQKTYDYVTSYLIDEDVSTGDIVSLDNIYKNIYGSNGTSTDTDKAYFIYNDNKTNQSVVVKADGSSVLNVYYDRKPVTLNFNTWQNDYTQSNTGTYGFVDGQYVYLSSSGGNRYYLQDTNGNPVPAGTTVYRNGDWWRDTTEPYYNYTYYSDTNNNSSNRLYWIRYTGTRYNSSMSWQLYDSFTGLYSSTFAENDYTWPTEYWWYDKGGNNGNTSGTRTTVMTAFLPTDVDTSGNTITKDFYGSNSSGSVRINFYVQKLDGSYELREYVGTNGGTFYITDKYIGYHASQYRANNGSWQNAGTPNSSGYYNNGAGVSYSTAMDIRFDLNNYTLTFYTNNGSNQVVDYTVPYSKSLAEYASQNQGQKNGYYFLGWYADPACTEPFDFTQTMPDSNLAVYGKWKMERFRIVIDPGANNVYMGSQATRFRLDYDEHIDGGLMEAATRAGYILDGWYTDPEFTNRFLFTNPVNSSTPGVDMTYHTSPSWAAARAAYGDDTEAYENVRGILHLYAKWIPDPNSQGINIVYDAGEAALYDSLGTSLTTVPIDSHMYGFDGTATGREAPSNYNDLYTFKYWEATKEDGTTVTIHSGDPIELADLTFTDPVYDEITGELLRKTVTLRAVYELTGDPSRITHITYDGDTFTETKYGTGQTQTLQGEARDGTHRRTITLDEEINQTIVLPGEEDFYLDGYKLVGWSFFEGSLDEQRAALDEYNASHPENILDNFTPGQEVAADNLDQGPVNDRENILYAMWEPKTYRVTVRQVIENGVPDHSFTYVYKTGEENGIGNMPDETQNLTGNSSFDVEDLGYYERTGDVIRITTPTIPDDASYSVRVNAIVTKDDGTTEILNPTASGDYQILGDVVITYTYSQKVPVKLQKRDATNHDNVLRNAVFTVTPVEFNSSTQHWENAGSGQTLTVDRDSLEKYLQEGTYRIVEVTAPENFAKIGSELYLTVKKDESFTLFAENGSEIDSSIAELDSSGKILTVYDEPIHTVTLSKTVENGEEGSFSFKVTVFNSDNTRLGNYVIGSVDGSNLTTNNIGEATVLLSHGQSLDLKLPDGSKLTVEEMANTMYEASYQWNSEESVSDRVFGIDPVSITDDGRLAYTNNIAAVQVTLKKVGINNTDTTPEEQDLKGATFTVYESGTGGTPVHDADGNVLSGKISGDNGVFYSGKLKLGTYYLEETGVPDGYNAPLGRFKLVVDKETANTVITGEWITGDPSSSAGTVTGNIEAGYVITVRNVAGAALPSTGGHGTTIFYLLGIMLTGLAGTSLLMRRRKV